MKASEKDYIGGGKVFANISTHSITINRKMKAPERTTYIYRIIGEQRYLEMVCPTISAASRFIARELDFNVRTFRIEGHIDTEIPVGNTYVLTSYLKWKSKEKQINDVMIQAANKPQHLRFTGFSYKFDECDELQESIVTKSK